MAPFLSSFLAHNLASNVKMFLRIAAAQPECQALFGNLANDPQTPAQLSLDALALSAAQADPDREHPADAALAVYLWLLGNHPAEFGRVAAAILRDAGRFFWARKFAERHPPLTGLLRVDAVSATSATNGTADAWASQQKS